MGTPNDVEGPSEVITNPIYSTGVGLLKYAFQLESYVDIDQTRGKKDQYTGFISKFREFILKILKNEGRG